ncbi:ATP-dependent helicase [Providencia alcalifaciens]|uniref:ATP-dependent helicase n=1 Tax=Providencia alcalifaciens TaxID=126385 RepID=UPI00044C1B59|nr:ATP-dependent helicase [Providencia alcalifaciens]EUD07296.1 UvrD/REP helicase N-terminal domain protein [Providencia alcalifaciens R90-1475]
MLNLSESQAQIVNASLANPIQVLASAGSGKTRVLTERVRYILDNTKRDGIIALTFTNKAAEEMTARLADCDDAEDRAWIATIHSVAQRILEKYGHTVGLPTELYIYDRDKDRMEVFMQSLRDDGVDIDEYLNIADSKELRNREKNLQDYMDIFSKIKRELLTELEVAELYPNSNIWKVFQDYQSSLINSGGIDYDDILVYAHRILLTHEWIAKVYRSKYKHVCVDEAQDLNQAQYEFIKALCGDVIKSVLMVGDPNQMIYGFNGSSKDYLCTHFVDDFSPQKFELKENYRSTKAVIRAANRLKQDSQKEIEYALEGKINISEFDTEEAEADYVTSTIQYLLSLQSHDEIEGELSLDKMVVIARNRFVFSKLERSLKEKSIPYSLRKGERQLEPSTTFGKVLDYALRIKLNPKDWVDGKKLCQVLSIAEPESWTSETLLSMAAQVSFVKGERAELLSKLLSAIDGLDIENPKIPKLVQEFNDYLTSLVENQSEVPDDKSEDVKLSLEELKEFSGMWTRFKRKGFGDSLVAFRNALALGQLSESSIDEGLTLSTVHTMKGLEKDIVFLIGMCEGVFPDYRARTAKELDEERNNAFVAVTRAKRWLYVSYPKQRMMPWGDLRFQQKSRFISEIE